MKKSVIILTVLMAAVLLTSCVTTSPDIKGTGAELAVNKPVIIDYKGAALGADIPGWVTDAANGDNEAVKASLKLNGKKIWVLTNTGDDLDMLKLWTDQVDARAQIASGIEQTVADLITAEMNAKQADESSKQKMVDEFSSRVTNITLQGLDKHTDYWTYTRRVKTGVKKPKTDDDYIEGYTYLVVFTMDEALFQQQLEAAFSDVEDNDNQSELLREVVTSQLANKLEMYAAD